MIARVALLVVLGFICIGSSDALNGRLTHYCSYPPCCKSNISPPYTDAEKKACPGSSECDDYNGCKWEGQFAFCGTKSHDYVVKTNIVALFSKHGDIAKYRNKKIRVTQGSRSIDAIVCDTCGDSDCNGCCSANAGPSGYLVDMESNTYARFGGKDGDVTWTCLDC